MLIEPATLATNFDRLEEIERASLRLVVQALVDFRQTAAELFPAQQDLVQDVAEDVTRSALDRVGLSRIDDRLVGKIDYKMARYVFHPDYGLRQALFVDSKAEKAGDTVTLQTAQSSLRIRQYRSGRPVDIAGKLAPIIRTPKGDYITTTIFVKFTYDSTGGQNRLLNLTVSALPNGFLQGNYNPTADDTIWIAGRNAPTRGEEFRVRLSFRRLEAKARWRVQRIPMHPGMFRWVDEE